MNLHSSFVTGSRGRRVPGVGQQVLPGSRRRGRGQHHAGHLHQELLGRHQSHHTADAVPQQGRRITTICFGCVTIKERC